MSQKYVQRGELAIASFAKRKAMALKYGANRVYRLPFKYSTQAAHIFAYGAIMLAIKKGATKLFFGSESNNVENLLTIAQLIKDKNLDYNVAIKKYLKQGYSFPKANALALEEIHGQAITLPNDILGLEYCKIILKYNLNLEPITLKRTIAFRSPKTNGHFASASTLRTMIFNHEKIKFYSPMKFKKIPRKIEDKYPAFQKLVKNKSLAWLQQIQLMNEGMEYLFKKHIQQATYDDFVQACTSKRYTASRIKRTMLYVLLKVKKHN